MSSRKNDVGLASRIDNFKRQPGEKLSEFVVKAMKVVVRPVAG